MKQRNNTHRGTIDSWYLQPGLPDGLFSNQKSQFGQSLDVRAMEDVWTFFEHVVYFTTIWYILWSFGIFSPVLVC
jgi:hypothetical protein